MNSPEAYRITIFSMGQPTDWIPNKSFFRVDATITGINGIAQPTVNEQIAYADNMVAGMYDNAYFRGGGQDISSVVNYLPQASQVKNRLSKSGAWLKSVGKSAYMMEADFQTRSNMVSSGVKSIMDGTSKVINVGDATHFTTALISVLAADGVATGTNTAFQTNGIVAGDKIMINGSEYNIMADPATETALIITPKPTANITNTSNVYIVRAGTDTDSKNRVFAMFQPPIGIFDHEQPIGAGDFRVQLNPSSNFKSACVESKNPNSVAGTSYNVVINDVKFYVATIKMDIPNSIQTLHLNEIQVQSKTGSGNDTLHFTVPPSTQAITIFAQSNDSGSNVLVPPMNFKCKDGSQNNLNSLQLTYANTTKPSTRWQSKYGTGDNRIQHRYLQNLEECGLIHSDGGAETLDDYVKRGIFIHYSYEKDENDLSTECQLQIDYSSLEANAKIFLVAHFRRSTEITTANGMIQEVRSLNR